MSNYRTDQPSSPPRVLPLARAGFTLIELMIALTVLTIAASGMANFFTAVPRMMDQAQRKRMVMDEALGTYEELRGQDFETIFARYNETILDDPLLVDSPGDRRTLTGSTRALGDGAARPATVRIYFPTPAGGHSQLREDTIDPSLGMPRDLNGDGVIDGLNHASDYVVLPVRIEVTYYESGTQRTHSETLTLSEDWS